MSADDTLQHVRADPADAAAGCGLRFERAHIVRAYPLRAGDDDWRRYFEGLGDGKDCGRRLPDQDHRAECECGYFEGAVNRGNLGVYPQIWLNLRLPPVARTLRPGIKTSCSRAIWPSRRKSSRAAWS